MILQPKDVRKEGAPKGKIMDAVCNKVNDVLKAEYVNKPMKLDVRALLTTLGLRQDALVAGLSTHQVAEALVEEMRRAGWEASIDERDHRRDDVCHLSIREPDVPIVAT